MEQFISFLRERRYRVTIPRKTLFALFEESESSLSIKDILRTAPQLDRISVYRTLDLFTHLGIVQKIPRGWKHVYELAGEFRHHHHHFTCTSCGDVLSIQSTAVEEVIATLELQHRLRVMAHTFELHGTCDQCS